MNAKEKIRQFVIMARHPEAKSYEEALSIETEYKDNLYEWFYINTKGKRITQISNKVPSYNKGFQNLGRPITALDVCWALNKKTGEFDFGIERRGISFTRICTMEADGNFVSCMPLLKNIKNGIFVFQIIKSDGTHTVLENWDNKICEKMEYLFFKS
jgi:hypothetical protein